MADWETIKTLSKREGETPKEFAERLVELGAREIAARIRLRMEFGLDNWEAAMVCNDVEGLRIREIADDMLRHPGRTRDGRMLWIVRNFPVDDTQAAKLLQKAEA